MYMVAETTVAESIRIVDQKAAYDAACKRVLAEKIILAWVMKHCLGSLAGQEMALHLLVNR